MTSFKNWITPTKYLLLLASGALLLIALAQLGPKALSTFPNEDYIYFRESAQMLVSGLSPYARPKLFYPLYTVIWLFTPLLAGDWTRAIWVLGPILFLFLILGRKAVVLLPFYPLLVHLRFGQVDGWLILPLWFLLRNAETLAPLSAAAFLFKPQAAWALVVYRLMQWVRRRIWRNLALSLGLALLLILPAFWMRPDWLREWLASVAAHPSEACQNATIWGWSCFGSQWLGLSLVEGGFALALLWRARDQASSIQLFGMLITPILYAYDYILVAVTLKTWHESLLLLAVSWLAVVLDVAAGGWGGAYSLIPLTALALRSGILTPEKIKNAENSLRVSLAPPSHS